jgi:hypothetical protein
VQGQQQGAGHGRAPRLGVLVEDVDAAAALRLMEQGSAVQVQGQYVVVQGGLALGFGQW